MLGSAPLRVLWQCAHFSQRKREMEHPKTDTRNRGRPKDRLTMDFVASGLDGGLVEA